MKSLIARKQKRNANCYKVAHGRRDLHAGKVIKFADRKKLNNDDPIYTINYNNKPYIIKQIGHYGEEEWDNIQKMITRNYECPYMINYHACIRSMSNHKRYIMMDKADMDLKDFLNKYYEAPYTREFVLDIIDFVFKYQRWCIKYLKMVYIDLKCNNIMVFLKENENPDAGFDLRFIDMELMEYAEDNYKPDVEMLHDDSVINFMFPRRECSNQQFALFAMAMFVLELCVLGLDIDAVVPGTEEESKTNTEEEEDTDREQNSQSADESEEETGSSMDISDEDSSSEDDSSSSGEYSSEDDSSYEEDEFISLLDGRESDERLTLLMSKLEFFRDEKNKDLYQFLSDLIDFKYESVEEAHDVYKKIYDDGEE
jgi:hypothetical protein